MKMAADSKGPAVKQLVNNLVALSPPINLSQLKSDIKKVIELTDNPVKKDAMNGDNFNQENKYSENTDEHQNNMTDCDKFDLISGTQACEKNAKKNIASESVTKNIAAESFDFKFNINASSHSIVKKPVRMAFSRDQIDFSDPFKGIISKYSSTYLTLNGFKNNRKVDYLKVLHHQKSFKNERIYCRGKKKTKIIKKFLHSDKNNFYRITKKYNGKKQICLNKISNFFINDNFFRVNNTSNLFQNFLKRKFTDVEFLNSSLLVRKNYFPIKSLNIKSKKLERHETSSPPVNVSNTPNQICPKCFHTFSKIPKSVGIPKNNIFSSNLYHNLNLNKSDSESFLQDQKSIELRTVSDITMYGKVHSDIKKFDDTEHKKNVKSEKNEVSSTTNKLFIDQDIFGCARINNSNCNKLMKIESNLESVNNINQLQITRKNLSTFFSKNKNLSRTNPPAIPPKPPHLKNLFKNSLKSQNSTNPSNRLSPSTTVSSLIKVTSSHQKFFPPSTNVNSSKTSYECLHQKDTLFLCSQRQKEGIDEKGEHENYEKKDKLFETKIHDSSNKFFNYDKVKINGGDKNDEPKKICIRNDEEEDEEMREFAVTLIQSIKANLVGYRTILFS